VYSIIKAAISLGVLNFGAALVLTGLTVLLGFVLVWAGKLAVKLGKWMVRGLKALLIRKEDKT
jgi:hypothetical protein